jgi:hypothetical protein
MHKIIVLFIVLTFSKSFTFAQVKSGIPDNAKNSVVLLEKKIGDNYLPHGTGFLLKGSDSKNPIIVVTNEHVLRNSSVYVTVPADSALINYLAKINSRYVYFKQTKWELFGNKLRHEFNLIPDSTFFYNKEFDIGVFKINIGNSVDINDDNELKISSLLAINPYEIKLKKDIPLGTDVFFVGFPFSIGTELGWYYKGFTKLYSEFVPSPVIRKGCVAWISESDNRFLLDAFSYSGNSGSPIFTVNDLRNKPYLIGIVSGHLPSEESDNIGLANCIWMDEIYKLIEKLE